jgi:hypothetical protein
MKKIFFVTTITIFTAFVARSQNIHFGLKAGLNVASISQSDGNDFDSRTGFHAGALAHIHVTDHLAVQPEIVYSMQGGERGNLKRRLNYINVPVLAQYMFHNCFRLQTGPQLGLCISSKDKLGNVEVNIEDGINTAEFAWVFGAGYLFTKSGFGIDARYNLGISNIYESESPEGHNRVFQVGVFYQFMH